MKERKIRADAVKRGHRVELSGKLRTVLRVEQHERVVSLHVKHGRGASILHKMASTIVRRF
jgi:hypothetical protein